jgi:predicted aldo/keto reductase-like oxidoreductase
MGAMRLPMSGGEIDLAEGTAMIDRLMAAGVNYYDTAYMYHGGKSEGFLRKALIERHERDKFTVADKMPGEGSGSLAKAKEIFATQRERLGVDYVDYYMLHGIGKPGYISFRDSGVVAWLEQMKASGTIRRFGFSYHGSFDDYEWVLSQRDWDFSQIMLNYYDWSVGADTLYHTACDRGVPIIVMEPVRGGGLTRLPENARAPMREANSAASEASWALRWCASLPGVYVVLSGMSNTAQVEDNIRTFNAPNPLTDDEETVIQKVLTAMKDLPLIACTECRYCAGCPQGIDIARLFGAYNEYVRFASSWYMMHEYWKKPEGGRADACTECGFCEAKCPQKLGIIQELKKAHKKAAELKR